MDENKDINKSDIMKALDELLESVNEWLFNILDLAVSLKEIKNKLPKGEFGKYVKENCPFNYKICCRIINIHNRWIQGKIKTNDDKIREHENFIKGINDE